MANPSPTGAKASFTVTEVGCWLAVWEEREQWDCGQRDNSTKDPRAAELSSSQLFPQGKDAGLDLLIKQDLRMSPHSADQTDPQADHCLVAAHFWLLFKSVLLTVLIRELSLEASEPPVLCLWLWASCNYKKVLGLTLAHWQVSSTKSAQGTQLFSKT